MLRTLVDAREKAKPLPWISLQSSRGNKMSLWKREKCKTPCQQILNKSEGRLKGDEAGASVRAQRGFDRWLNGRHFWWSPINKLSKEKINLLWCWWHLPYAKPQSRWADSKRQQPLWLQGNHSWVGNEGLRQMLEQHVTCCWVGRGASLSGHDLPFCLDLLSPGSFHLIHLMFDDYVLYLLESLHCQERASELMRAMKGEGSTGKPAGHWELPPLLIWFNILTSLLCVSLALHPKELSYGEQVTWWEASNIFFFSRVGLCVCRRCFAVTMAMGSHQRVLNRGVMWHRFERIFHFVKAFLLANKNPPFLYP